MRLLINTLLFTFLCLNGLKAQVALSYYPFQSIVALSSDSEKTLWLDGRLESNTFLSNVNMEVNAMVNFRKRDYYNVYSGLGFNFNPFYAAEDLTFTNGYLLHFGLRFKPWQKHPNFQVAFEISPYLNSNFDGGTLRSLLGLSYNFNSNRI
tara:strand:+ start:63 stop:515 length:453 start_codon:yes stop_codon:yes gene_type:complete